MNPYNEEKRRLYWHEYFVSLRARDERRARMFQTLAREHEKLKKAARKHQAEQFQLPY